MVEPHAKGWGTWHAQPSPTCCQVPVAVSHVHSYPVQHGFGGWQADPPAVQLSPTVGVMHPASVEGTPLSLGPRHLLLTRRWCRHTR